jgi:hypothetical protein
MVAAQLIWTRSEAVRAHTPVVPGTTTLPMRFGHRLHPVACLRDGYHAYPQPEVVISKLYDMSSLNQA